MEASSCIVETMMPMKRLRIVKVAMIMKGTKKAHAHGFDSMTGRTIPIDQLSKVMIWNNESADRQSELSHCKKSASNSLVRVTNPI